MKKGSLRIIVLLSLLSILLIIIGCTLTDPYKKGVYNDNSKIAREADSYSFANRLGRTLGNRLDIGFSDFYGKQTIWEIVAAEDIVLEMDIKAEISGRFKICLVSPSKEVSVISEGSLSEKISFIVPKGTSSVTIVGNDASGQVQITIGFNPRVAIIPYEHLLR